MNARPHEFDQLQMPFEFQQCFDHQRAAYLNYPEPTRAERMADLDALARLLKDNRNRLVEAINLDYGNRSEFETLFAEFFVVLETIKHSAKNLKSWMKPQRRHIDVMMFPGASNRVIPQPLGVVGVIVPWNFPLNLSFCPLAAILAAGNRAMVKMSENSRHLAALLIEVSPKYFPDDKLRFFDDGGGRGPAFSSLPFDHLLFTGSGATGRSVMANAARNLTPVTLELGGKAPAVVGPDFPIKTAAERIMWVKMFNAGQICTNIDYVFLPVGAAEEFAAQCKRLFAERFPDINGNDYTSIIDERAYARLTATLEDARAKGARLVNLAEGQTPDAALRKFAPHLVFDPTPQMLVSQREIFGPILPVRTYRNAQEVADYINAHDRPLAIYPFTHDKALQNFYISRVMSGGVSVNEALLHVAQHDLPFGGVGPSGMGHYHSREGFNTFSKLRPVFYQGRFSAIQMLFQPPYAGRPVKLMNLLIRFRG
ncbi:coniferyl aldehyde dehydrogenase [Pseudoduganella sp. LjRoot289]|uniref:coniferyl aldehyde dehydrogenase n=1 Tax=Pseudoduganella sp. LjRoot289 TaxID=3342314 RepID=UPI003ECC6CF2